MSEIATNNGLHGNMLFYEVDHDLQFTVSGPVENRDEGTVTFTFTSHDSDEGEVFITYWATSGNLSQPDDDGFDVRISTCSDVWDLERTQQAINEAIRLHRHLGQNVRFEKFKDATGK